MALRVLDGNQSATTLSSVVTGGEHIVAHTVVSLGSNAIADITSAVSGSVVTIPGLARLGNSIASNNTPDSQLDFIKIGGHQDGQNQVAHIVHVSAGGAMKVDASGSSVTFTQAPVTFGAITGSASILNFPSTQTIAGTVTVGASSVTFNANVGARSDGSRHPLSLESGSNYVNARVYPSDVTPFLATVTVGNSVTIGSLPAISGTVTANLPLGNSFVYLVNGDNDAVVGSSNPIPVTGSVSIGNISADGGQTFEGFLSVKVDPDYYQVGLDRITPEVTVANLVNTGFFTTRFGTPTTANTVFATSAVTNGQRKYLLIQNVTTGSNVITVGIGFTPTTTQGIQLTAGAGITFESSYIPTGAVYVLSSVTASNFTILEA